MSLHKKGKWPCFFSGSSTTGEKSFEEFFTIKEVLDMDRFSNLGVIKNEPNYNEYYLNRFEESIQKLKNRNNWSKDEIVEIFFKVIPDLNYDDLGEYLDGKM